MNHSYNQENWNRKLKNDISIITKTIRNHIVDYKSIILAGGYGRGEGAWIPSSNEFGISPYNDYDIYIVSENKIPLSDLNETKKHLLNQLDVKWIDLENLDIKDVRNLKNTIRNFDLLHGSKVIDGDMDIRNEMPVLVNKKITKYDIETLFYTRLWTFFGSFDDSGFTDLDEQKGLFFQYQMAKAILAVIDVKLLLINHYESSYKTRYDIASSRFTESTWIYSLGHWAINQKLRPSTNRIDQADMQKLYDQTHEVYKNEMTQALRKVYPLFKIPFSYEFSLIFNPHFIVRRLFHKFVTKNQMYEREIKIRKIQMYLFLSYNNNHINEKYLLKANKILKKIIPYDFDFDWNTMRIIVSKLRVGE